MGSANINIPPGLLSNKEIKLVSPDNLDELIQYLHNEAKVI